MNINDAIKLEKSRLREIFKKKRLSLAQSEVKEKSKEINQNFIKNLLPKIYKKDSQKIFSLYLNVQNEVATDALAEFFLKEEIKFSYPKIVQKNLQLEFLLFTENQKFQSNKFYPNLSEPLEGEKVFPDFFIIPLLAFDSDLSRLGMGGGFFDRTISHFKKLNPNLVVIGFAYDFQNYEKNLPLEETDQKLDFIVTQGAIFTRELR